MSSAARARELAQLDVAQVARNLWIGAAPPEGGIVGERWDCLVLCANNWQPSSESYPGVKVLNAPFRDTRGATREEFETAISAAEWTANRMLAGHNCLVTCMEGRNRSGLVCALALSIVEGIDPAKSGEQVRRARGPIALTNPAFVNFLNAARGESCELCEHRRETPTYHEDHLCWVAICKACKVPMVVLRRHTTTPTTDERAHMTRLLFRSGGDLRPGRAWKLDEQRRSIPSHWHAHLRPA